MLIAFLRSLSVGPGAVQRGQPAISVTVASPQRIVVPGIRLTDCRL